MTNGELIRKIVSFQAKACCINSQGIARRAWHEIRDYLSNDEERSLSIAWEHFLVGEGRQEIDQVCKQILGTRRALDAKEEAAKILRDNSAGRGRPNGYSPRCYDSWI